MKARGAIRMPWSHRCNPPEMGRSANQFWNALCSSVRAAEHGRLKAQHPSARSRRHPEVREIPGGGYQDFELVGQRGMVPPGRGGGRSTSNCEEFDSQLAGEECKICAVGRDDHRTMAPRSKGDQCVVLKFATLRGLPILRIANSLDEPSCFPPARALYHALDACERGPMDRGAGPSWVAGARAAGEGRRRRQGAGGVASHCNPGLPGRFVECMDEPLRLPRSRFAAKLVEDDGGMPDHEGFTDLFHAILVKPMLPVSHVDTRVKDSPRHHLRRSKASGLERTPGLVHKAPELLHLGDPVKRKTNGFRIALGLKRPSCARQTPLADEETLTF